MNTLASHLTGGSFLLGETDPTAVFTPADLPTEERQIIDTAEKFMDKEVLPRLKPITKKEVNRVRYYVPKAIHAEATRLRNRFLEGKSRGRG